MAPSTVARRTLLAGIIVGAAGLICTLFSSQLLQRLYGDPRIVDDAYYLLAAAFSSLVSYALPLSAALIGAFLVMRHADARAREATPHDAGNGPRAPGTST
jgi:hypothetical protein